MKPYKGDGVKTIVVRAVAANRLRTELDRVENILSDPDSRLQSIMDSAIDAIILADEEGKIILWNNAASKLFLYAKEEVVGQALSCIMPERYREAHQKGLERARSTGEHSMMGRQLELHGRRKDGTEFPLELSLGTWKMRGRTFYTGIIRDITDRKRAEEALRKAEGQYRSIVENAVEGIFQTTPEGQFIKANPALVRMLGYDSPEELVSTISDIGHQLYRDPSHREQYKVLLEQEGVVRGFETQCYRKDGSLIWVSVNARAVRDSKGAMLFFEGTLEDITTRKLNAERLDRINKCLVGFSEDFNQNINALTALCGELLGGSCALYSYLDGDLLHSIGRWRTPPDFKAVHKPDGLICPDVIARGTNEVFVVGNLPETTYAETVPYVIPHGLRTYVGQAVKSKGRYVGSLCVLFQKDFVPTEDDRRLLGIIAAAVGVEEQRKQSREELRHAYNETEAVLSSLPSAILIANECQQIVWTNALADRYFSPNDRTLVGKSLSAILSPEVTRRAVLMLGVTPGVAAQGYGKEDGEFQEQERTYRYRCFPVALRGSTRPHIGLVIQDITEEKQMQEQLVHAERLASLGSLFAGMAHEVNNPAQAVIGLAELILEERDLGQIREHARDIARHTRHAAGVIRDFGSYTRPSFREESLDVDLNERLREALKMVSRTPQFGNVVVVEQLEPVPLIRARCSEIDQLFINLLSNAAQAMAGKGRLSLRTGCQGTILHTVISDTGCGIPKKIIDRIYDPFFTTKPSGKGTGLGLSVVQKIVKKYGGEISVASEENKGTTFTIQFPIGNLATTQ